MPNDILNSWFIQGMVKATGDGWLKGWHERNGGNISLRLGESDLAPYRAGFAAPREAPLTVALPKLAGQFYLVTGTGQYFHNVPTDPASTLGIIEVAPDGKAFKILWGYEGGGAPTSELSAHLTSHMSRQSASKGGDRVIMHSHATNLIALTYVLRPDTATITRALWEGSTECLVVFPDGVGVLPWMTPGTDAIGGATAEAMSRHSVVLWPFHGVFAAGPTLDFAFGLIDTAEKAAEVLVKVMSMGGPRQSMTTQNLRDLAARFGVTPLPEALALQAWAPLAEARPGS